MLVMSKVFCNVMIYVSYRGYVCIPQVCEFSQIQGGTADKMFYSSLTDNMFLSRAFLFGVVFMLLTKRWRR